MSECFKSLEKILNEKVTFLKGNGQNTIISFVLLEAEIIGISFYYHSYPYPMNRILNDDKTKWDKN